MNKKIIPAFPYPGKKTKLLKHILPLIPGHRRYIEPFAGGLAVFCAKEKAEVEVINDVNEELVIFYRFVRYHYEALLKELEQYHHSRKDFEKLRDSKPETDLQKAVRFFVCQWSSFGGQGEHWGRARESFRGFSIDRVKKRIEILSTRLRGVYIENLNWSKVLQFYDSDDAFIYCDPPYVQCGKTAYDPFTEIEMRSVCKTLERAKGEWILSCDNSEICRDIFKEYSFVEVGITYSLAKAGSTKTSELLVMSDGIANSHKGTKAQRKVAGV